MLYKLLMNYLRLRIFRMVLAKVLGKGGKASAIKNMSVMGYGLEMLISMLLKAKSRVK